MNRRVKVVLSIDTEEDNWVASRTAITLENIRQLQRLDRLFERLGATATYFTTYQVAVVPWAVEILRDLHRGGRAEIAAQLHPWNTPPTDEPFLPANTVTCRLPAELQAAKIRSLTDTLEEGVGPRPLSFRTGRWGLGPVTAAALLDQGYQVDSSVTPFVSWKEHDGGPSHVGAPLRAYRIDGRSDVRVPVETGGLIELPISSAYSRRPFKFWHAVHEGLQTRPLRALHLVGLGAKLGLWQKLMLSPELHSAAEMTRLARALLDDGVDYLHLTWHSSSLLPGLSPFVRTASDVDSLFGRIEEFLARLGRWCEFDVATVRDTAAALQPAPTRA